MYVFFDIEISKGIVDCKAFLKHLSNEYTYGIDDIYVINQYTYIHV